MKPYPWRSALALSAFSLFGALLLQAPAAAHLGGDADSVSADRDVLIRKPRESDKWSAQEHAGHLLDLEPLWRARVDDYRRAASQLTVADLSNRKTSEAQHNLRPIESILTEFRSERARLAGTVEELDPAIFARASLHPRLKTPLRLVDHLYFVAEHDDHHLAHIWALIHPRGDGPIKG